MTVDSLPVRIRPLRPDDVAAAHEQSFGTFAELDARVGHPVPQLTDDVRRRGRLRVAHLQRTDPDGAWVGETGGRLVGVALALRRGPLWFLSLLTVDPDLQGAGIGRRLLDAALGTAADAPSGLIMASEDPKALRRYAAAGFALHPGYDVRGTLDRALLPGGLDLREGDLAADADLVEQVVTGLRGAPYGPDLEVMAATGCRLLVAERGRERGFALAGQHGPVAVGATTIELARSLLWGAMAEAPDGELEVSFLTADQQWAIDVVLAARLSLRPGGSVCRRGPLGTLTPYLPGGAYG